MINLHEIPAERDGTYFYPASRTVVWDNNITYNITGTWRMGEWTMFNGTTFTPEDFQIGRTQEIEFTIPMRPQVRVEEEI